MQLCNVLLRIDNIRIVFPVSGGGEEEEKVPLNVTELMLDGRGRPNN